MYLQEDKIETGVIDNLCIHISVTMKGIKRSSISDYNLKHLHIHGLAAVHTDVLLMVLALCSYRLLRGAVTMLRAATQAVRHTIHLL